ncbi:MAG: hypothetical protein AB8I08_15040 [Sandaracinaceae bacterium]
MFDSTEAQSSLRVIVAVAALAGLTGCYDHHLCGTEEFCNLEDDDCDGRVDEGIVSDDGAYRLLEHCGTCGIDCRDQFPTAEDVACQDDPEAGPVCVLLSCPDGFHPAGEGACAPDVAVLCLPCEEDADCALRIPGARCLDTAAGQRRCGQPCDASSPCPDGFACTEGQCSANSGWCSCSEATEGAELACLIDAPGVGESCVGVQRCGADGPGPCEPALDEACNAQDDDCDGSVDEAFRDDEGRYVSRLHCGGCAIPCVEPGPNMMAECVADGAGVACNIACLEGFVDVDGILASGCECERFDGMGPPPVVGGDADCDGLPDDTDDFIFVTATGSDTNPGTLAQPMRTLNGGLARGLAEAKSVLVSRGIYEGPLDVVGGVSIFGGYSPDFRDRDLSLYPVVIERRADAPGLPAVECHDVREATAVEGFTVVGRDAVGPGEGSTAVFLDGCGPEVVFRSLEVLAGRGADGVNGLDSSERLSDFGFDDLDDLDGDDGRDGGPGNAGGICSNVNGGVGGRHVCRATDVSGGAGGAAACLETGCVNGSACGNAGCTDFTVGGVCDLDAATRDATPNPAPTSGRGPNAGARGVLTYNAPTNRGVCNFCDDNPTLPRDSANGDDGGLGGDGAGGMGCGVAERLDPATGRLAGFAGTNGTDGAHGSGGGGGSAGAGYDVIGGTLGECSDRSGGSGGGGGSGGCGAPAATAGTGGGVSAAVVVRLGPGLTSGPLFEESRAVTASGGRGGDGGVGADGGRGGAGAPGGIGRHWCARTGGRGGDGGRGGAGGGGGGGCGGGSYGIYVDAAGPVDTYVSSLTGGVVIEETGVPGRGGRGGFSPSSPGGAGTNGGSGVVFVAP